jgi:hypothetical protein
MGFLKKLFGGQSHDGERPDQTPADPQGIYFFVQCDRCGAVVRLRADKQYDLINEGDGYVWHKTIVDNRCFRPIPTVVRLNAVYEVVDHEISGGRYVSRKEYEAYVAAQEATGPPAE